MRRTGFVLVLCTVFIVASRSFATDYRKLSGYVRQFVFQQPPAFSRGATPLLAADGTLTAFVRIDADHASDVLSAYGCQSYAQKGDIAIVSIPLNNIGALSDHPAVRRIEASPIGRVDMDTTAVIIGADRAWQPMSPLQGTSFTGEGVVLGIMDIGFDLTHPNFYDSTASRCRIGALWDQLSRDTVDSPFPVGRDFVGADLVRAQLHSYDGLEQTHGTHTLGIAAGSGWQSPYKGIAYDADICVVANVVGQNANLVDSACLAKYTTAVDALGFKYMFDYADSLGKPCVASFSEGYPPYLDQEDSLFAAFLDSLSGPGHIIVASAGNEGLVKSYAEKPSGVISAGAFIQASDKAALYRARADGPLTFGVYAYTDSSQPVAQLRFPSVDVPVDSVLSDTLSFEADTCVVMLTRYASCFTTDTIYNIYFEGSMKLSELPAMALVMEGRECHAELFGSSSYALTEHAIAPHWNAAQGGRNVHAPACFPSVICVGSTAHRMGFTNYKGQYLDYSEGRIAGRRSPYSSTGPAMDGSMKPDVMAPGDNIISSYSSFYLENKSDASDIKSDVQHFDFQGRTYAWNANTGTSMATPIVAGVIALWLQAKPDLTPQEVVSVLSRTSRHPEETAIYPNTDYGYGEIDAYSGLLCILGVDRIESVSQHQPQLLHLSLADNRLQLQFDAFPSFPIAVRIFTLNGAVAYTTTIAKGTDSCVLPSLPSGLYVVQADCADHRFSGSQIVRLTK